MIMGITSKMASRLFLKKETWGVIKWKRDAQELMETGSMK